MLKDDRNHHRRARCVQCREASVWRAGASSLPRVIALPFATPLIDPAWQALHRGLAGRPWTGPPSEIADRARRGQVAVIAAATVPELAPHLVDAVDHWRRVDALLSFAADRLGPIVTPIAPVALLKGSAAAALVYPESAWRQRRDLDLLVGDALPEIRRALLAHGFSDAHDRRRGDDPTRVRAWNMAVQLGGGTVNVDLHRALVHTPWCRPDVAGMLARRLSDRGPLPVTDHADTIVNTMIHLLGTGFHEPLKGWIDILRLLPRTSPATLAERATQHSLITGTWLCLGVLGRWFEAEIAAYHDRLGKPLQAGLLQHLASGQHATPERRPLPRGLAYRLWPQLVRDLGPSRS